MNGKRLRLARFPVYPQLVFLSRNGPALADWMVEQIAVAYDVPHRVIQKWVQNEQILPLLDGLDEMNEAARPACIAAIKAYHRTHLTPLVVCSRTTEYESTADKQRLVLQSAVVVRPLTSKQVEVILDRAGDVVASLQAALHRQPALRNLATTPLMLSVLMLAYQGTTVRTSELDEMVLEQEIWTDYIQRMVERKQRGHVKRYSLSQMRSALGWLAQQMRLHDQTIFYGERLQSNWLPNRHLRAFTWLAERIPAIIIGILANLLVWFFLGYSYDLATLFQIGFVGAFLGGWISRISRLSNVSSVDPLPTKKRSSHVLAHLGSSLILGVLFGTCFGFNVNGSSYLPGDWLHDGILSAIGIGFSGWVMLCWLFHVSQGGPPVVCGSRFCLAREARGVETWVFMASGAIGRLVEETFRVLKCPSVRLVI